MAIADHRQRRAGNGFVRHLGSDVVVDVVGVGSSGE